MSTWSQNRIASPSARNDDMGVNFQTALVFAFALIPSRNDRRKPAAAMLYDPRELPVVPGPCRASTSWRLGATEPLDDADKQLSRRRRRCSPGDDML